MAYGRTQAVLIGGAFNGILSALPIVGAANICCCLWVTGGGAITAWLMQQGRTVAMRVADGAIGGALAGLAGAFFYTAVATPIGLVMAPEVEAVTEMMVWSGVPAEIAQFYEAVTGDVILMATLNLGLWLVVGVIFSTVGGLLGALFASRGAPPPAPPAASSGAPVVPPPPIAPDA